ncbi:MAG: hypothetical protein NT157_05995 [Candidatus Micrarchaeota archaeon]|nr:hypothetical protein [Candidatus Micrarchaeota archaeon]
MEYAKLLVVSLVVALVIGFVFSGLTVGTYGLASMAVPNRNIAAGCNGYLMKTPEAIQICNEASDAGVDGSISLKNSGGRAYCCFDCERYSGWGMERAFLDCRDYGCDTLYSAIAACGAG